MLRCTIERSPLPHPLRPLNGLHEGIWKYKRKESEIIEVNKVRLIPLKKDASVAEFILLSSLCAPRWKNEFELRRISAGCNVVAMWTNS
jgi:hypothetical protein